MFPNRGLAIALSLVVLAAGCGGATPTPAATPLPNSQATATPVTLITRERAIESAIQMCRVPHMVLLGEPRNIRAQLVGPLWQVQTGGQPPLLRRPPPPPR